MANSRIQDVQDEGVTFRTRGDHAVTLHPIEFMRRFLRHVLPKGYVKIRHYGLLAAVNQERYAQAVACLGPVHHSDDVEAVETEDLEGVRPLRTGVAVVRLAVRGAMPCPACAAGTMVRHSGGLDPPK